MGRGTGHSAAISAADIRGALRPRVGSPAAPSWQHPIAPHVLDELDELRRDLRAMDFRLADPEADPTLEKSWETEQAATRGADRVERVLSGLRGLQLDGDAGLNLAITVDQLRLACDHEDAEQANRSMHAGLDALDAALREITRPPDPTPALAPPPVPAPSREGGKPGWLSRPLLAGMDIQPLLMALPEPDSAEHLTGAHNGVSGWHGSRTIQIRYRARKIAIVDTRYRSGENGDETDAQIVASCDRDDTQAVIDLANQAQRLCRDEMPASPDPITAESFVRALRDAADR